MEKDGYDQDLIAPKRVPWDADSTTPNGLTSLDVLLTWMLTPGKYERFHGERRSKAILNILTALKRQGLEHRTESAIRSKVRSIENQYLAAERYLAERDINSENILTGALGNETEAKVLSICPHFNELLPIFRHSRYLKDLAASQTYIAKGDQAEETDSDDKGKLARSKAKRKAKKEAQRPRKRRQIISTEVTPNTGVEGEEDYSEVARVLNCVRRTSANGKIGGELDLSSSQNWFERTDHYQLVVHDQLPSEFQRQIAEVRLDHEKKRSEAFLESETKMRDEMMKCDIDVKRGRGQVQLVLDRVLARRMMKKEGVPKDEIDVAIPLKEQSRGKSTG